MPINSSVMGTLGGLAHSLRLPAGPAPSQSSHWVCWANMQHTWPGIIVLHTCTYTRAHVHTRTHIHARANADTHTHIHARNNISHSASRIK